MEEGVAAKNMKEIDFAFYSDIGGRETNEDAFLAKRFTNGFLFIVADGLGGYADGELASQAAVGAIKDILSKNGNIQDAVKCANKTVNEMQENHNSKMKTTISVAYMDERETTIAHVGDSRIYAFKEGEIVFQSLDHSASQLAVAVGEITADEIRSHPDRNKLTRALGVTEDVKTDITVLKNDEIDALLLCSDGFWEYVYEGDMKETLRSSSTAERWLYKMRMLQLDRLPENCDNSTAIAVKL